MKTRASTLLALGLLAAGAGCGGSSAPRVGPSVLITESDASYPTVAVDPQTRSIYVAWIATGGDEANVYLARSEDGATFSEPVRVNDVPGDAAAHGQAPAQVAIGPDGEVYVVWQNNTHVEGRRFPASDLRFARSTNGGRSFGPAMHVNDDAGGPPASHTFQDIAVARDGAIHVAWIDGRAGTPEHAGVGSAGAEGARDHAVGGTAAVAPTGSGHASHSTGSSDAGPDIRIARSDDGGLSFRASVMVDRNACPCCRVSLIAGEDGEVHVAWRKIYEGSGVDGRDIAVASSRDRGTSFAPPVRVREDGWALDACPHAGPAIAVDGAGGLHAAWYTGREGREGIHHAVAHDGARFGLAASVLTGPVPPSQVRLAASGPDVWIAWEDRRADPPRIVLARAGPDGSIGRATVAGRGSAPALAATHGFVAVVWQDAGAVRFARLDPDT